MLKNKKKYQIVFFTLIICCLSFLTGCMREDKEEIIYDSLEKLEGKRIGMVLGWAPDAILTEGDNCNFELKRYSSIGTLIMALKYKKIEAVALERGYAEYLVGTIPGLKKFEDPIANDYLVACTTIKKGYLKEQFDEFIDEFRKSDDYPDYVRRTNILEGGVFEEVDIPLTGTGEVLTFSHDSAGYPFTYWDAKNDKPKGADYELVCRFANRYNYKLNVIKKAGPIGAELQSGRTDIYLCCTSYAFMITQQEKYFNYSKPYLDTYIDIVYVDDYSALSHVPKLQIESE